MEGVQIASGNAVAASLMRWWREAGVDTFVDDTPRDWLAPPRPVSAPAQATPETAAPPSPAPASIPLPDTLDALLTWMRESGDVPEARWGRKRLLPAGNPQADIAIMIDAPDPADMAAGTLLSGEIGALFDKMLAAIGLDRAAIWLTPFATIRPLGRVPQDAVRRLTEIAHRQIGLVAPKRLLIMGDTPSRALIGTEVIPARGRLHSLNLGGATVEAVATFLPRLLNEKQSLKAQAWKDLQLLMSGL